jgi:hypothetical protein
MLRQGPDAAERILQNVSLRNLSHFGLNSTRNESFRLLNCSLKSKVFARKNTVLQRLLVSTDVASVHIEGQGA